MCVCMTLVYNWFYRNCYWSSSVLIIKKIMTWWSHWLSNVTVLVIFWLVLFDCLVILYKGTISLAFFVVVVVIVGTKDFICKFNIKNDRVKERFVNTSWTKLEHKRKWFDLNQMWHSFIHSFNHSIILSLLYE